MIPHGNRYVLIESGQRVRLYLSKKLQQWLKSWFQSLCRFGVPHGLQSDQGTTFESKVMAEVCKLLDNEKTRTSPLHPQSDAQVENQEDWGLQFQTCMTAYRSSVHESTGETPKMFKVPLDVITEPPPDSSPLTNEYASALQQRLLIAHNLAC